MVRTRILSLTGAKSKVFLSSHLLAFLLFAAFDYDEAEFPLRASLSSCLGCSDAKLELFHAHSASSSSLCLTLSPCDLSKKDLLAGLLDATKRRVFHEVFDRFVRRICLPQLKVCSLFFNCFSCC